MAIHIITHGKDVVHCGPLRLWAERGLIHVEDGRDNSYQTMPVKEALLRVNALNEFRPGIDGTEDKLTKKWVYGTQQQLRKLIEQMIDIIRKAQAQGMPTDPTASHALRAARPTTVVMPRNKVLRETGKGKNKRIGVFDDFS